MMTYVYVAATLSLTTLVLCAFTLFRLDRLKKEILSSIQRIESSRQDTSADRYGLDERLGEIRHKRFSPYMGRYTQHSTRKTNNEEVE
jgi:hypothetical protein